jgi:hypothetical protein
MIVFGDPGREEPIETILEALRADIQRALNAPRGVDCDALRRILVRAGELEQAAFDMPASPGSRSKERRLRALRTATSLAARAFHAACDSPRGGAAAVAQVSASLARLQAVLARLPGEGGPLGRAWVQVPRGFAFDALFPERYREGALRWIDSHSEIGSERVLVVGLRGTGTTLSAVVTAALRARGVRARRITVRTRNGLKLRPLRPAAHALIVDGESSDSEPVAEALQAAGIERVQSLGPADDAPVEGGTLAEALWNLVDPLGRDSLARVTSCRGGAWRRLCYDHPDAWPAVCAALERPKLLLESKRGRKVLFKFAGFATAPGTTLSLAEHQAMNLDRLARRGFTPAPLGTVHGYVATEWLEGRRLTPRDMDAALAARIGTYIAAASGPPLSASGARSARNRVETMLARNTAEALGDGAAALALSLFRPVAVLEQMPRSGDGRLAPHEWIRTADGEARKLDAGGHDLDPTWAGRQPVLWDLAGAILEWDLDAAMEEALLAGYSRAGGYSRAPLALDAYRAAYAAHRVGQMGLARETESDAPERERIERDYARWRATLARCLGSLSREGLPAPARSAPHAPVV